jgi:NodT family efflux transporter outer membrane factor (OMF) lipoprotein
LTAHPSASAVVSLACAAALSGCTLTPKAQPEAGPLPQQWAAAVEPPQAASPSAWWETFADPTLEQLALEAFAQNIDLQQALLRVTEARAAARATIAQNLPVLSLQAQGQYTNVLRGPPLVGSFQQFIVGGGGGELPLEDQQAFLNYGPQFSWEVPLFGLLPLSLRGAKLTRLIALEDVRAAQVALVSDIGAAYVDLRAAQNRQVVLAEALRVADQLAGVLEDTVASGFTAPVDAADARRQAETTRARLPDAVVAETVARIALAVLRGQAPGVDRPELAAALATRADIPNQAYSAAPVAPADLLRLRPDVARAERQALLAAVEVGAARHELLPKLTITGNIGLANNLIGFPLPDQVGQLQITPLVTMPLFDWGARLSAVRQERTQFQSALLEYRDVVNRAVGEADQALVELAQAKARLDAARAAEASAARTAEGARQAFEAGFRSLRERLQTDQLLLEARLARIEAEAAQARASLAAYRAFAGALSAPV